jgi:hypothetical protein
LEEVVVDNILGTIMVDIILVVQELLGLFGQVARFPIAFPEYVAEW